MKHFLKKLGLKTKRNTGLYDITDNIEKVIKKSAIFNGHVLIQSEHTTAGIYVNENEKNLFKDLVAHLEECAPKSGEYFHDNVLERDCPSDEPKNGHSHIKAALYSNPSLSLILYGGKLQLGKWQKIFFAEFDGPCPRKHKNKRRYLVSIIGE